MTNWIKLLPLRNGSVPVRVTVESADSAEEFQGIVLEVSSTFLVVLNIDGWHTDGISVFPISKIKSCVQDVDFESKRKIFKWLNVELSPDYSWVTLDSYKDLFSSIASRNKVFYISDASSAEVGLIRDIGNDGVILRGIDGVGDWLPEAFEFKFDDIDLHLFSHPAAIRVLGIVTPSGAG